MDLAFKNIYNQEELENDLAANNNRSYQQCSISVMDTIADPDISFDTDGICNYYHEFQKAMSKDVPNQVEEGMFHHWSLVPPLLN